MLLNTINSRFYIGSTLNLKLRIADHFNKLKGNRHDNKRLQNCYNKNGNNFEVLILEECNQEKLLEIEQFWIDIMQPYYNICKVAGRTSGYVHEEQSKLNMSISKKKLYQEGFKVWNVGISHAQETKDKISNTLKGKFVGENAFARGLVHTEESKKLMVAASNRRKGTHNASRRGRVFKLDRITEEAIDIYLSAPIAAKTLNRWSGTSTVACKICEAARFNRNAYGFKWVFERDLDQIKVDELLESLRLRSISSQAIDTSIEGSETT